MAGWGRKEAARSVLVALWSCWGRQSASETRLIAFVIEPLSGVSRLGGEGLRRRKGRVRHKGGVLGELWRPRTAGKEHKSSFRIIMEKLSDRK